MIDREKLLDFLTNIQAFAQPHSGGNLGDHLMNVFDILDAMDCPMAVCLAGGLHSVYGTCHFNKVSEDRRSVVSELFGVEVEYLVFLYATINRPFGLEHIDELRIWRSNEPLTLDPRTVEELRTIDAANLLEQGVDLSQYPLIAATMDARIESSEGES